jgi:hypothetical protein
VESLHILGGFRTDTRWLFLCEMESSNSALPMLVMFHSKWKPTAYWQFSRGAFTHFKADEWETEYAVVMPPSAWNESRAWSAIK